MSETVETYFPQIADIYQAAKIIAQVAEVTPLQQSIRYSKSHGANILLKREDLHRVRSYKIRGAYNKISSLGQKQLDSGVVCASAGNHAQGVAFACSHLQVKGTIYMPVVTPKQKIDQTNMFGGEWVDVVLEGDTFDDSKKAAQTFCEQEGKTFVHPFDDEKTIEGQATVGLEILQQSSEPIDYVFVAVGGGGLASGLCGTFQALSPNTKIIGVEPEGAPSMLKSIEQGELVELENIDKFIDGAAVQKVGSLTFPICKAYLVEPAGALTIAALDYFKEEIKGKNVVCVVSGSNNDITRTAEIKERALLYGQLKHYFIVRFPQRPGALKEFVVDILGPNDDITHFEYSKKSSRENAPAIVGVELKSPEDLEPLIQRMKENNFFGDYLNNKPDLFQYLV